MLNITCVGFFIVSDITKHISLNKCNYMYGLILHLLTKITTLTELTTYGVQHALFFPLAHFIAVNQQQN